MSVLPTALDLELRTVSSVDMVILSLEIVVVLDMIAWGLVEANWRCRETTFFYNQAESDEKDFCKKCLLKDRYQPSQTS